MEEINEIEQPANFTLEKAKDKGAVRAVIITMFNYTEKHIQMFKDLITEKKATYVVFQEELTPKTKKPHIQGYIEFGKPTKWNFLCQTIGHMWVGKRKGTPEECFDYCSKQKSRKPGTTFWEGGVRSKGSGSRSDLEHVQQEVHDKVPVATIAKENFATWCKHRKSIDAYIEMIADERSEHTLGVCIWGAADAGKSRTAFELFKSRCVIAMGNCGTWWDMYTHQEAVIFDEFSGWIKFNNFKNLIDMYPTTCDSKGTTKIFNSRFAVFTSNGNPYGWYTMEKDNAEEAFDRRIHINLEAVKRPSETFAKNHDGYFCRPHRVSLPFGANMREGWKLRGLTSSESRELIAFNTPTNRRKELVTRSVTRLRLRGAGVILSPAIDPDWDFYTSARFILTETLFLSDVDDPNPQLEAPEVGKVAQSGLSSLSAASAASACATLDPVEGISLFKKAHDGAKGKTLAQQLAEKQKELQDKEEEQEVLWIGSPADMPITPPEVRTQVPPVPVQRAYKSAGVKPRPGMVRPDQRLSPRAKPKKSQYSRFGTNAFDSSDDEHSGNRITRSIAKQRKRSEYILDEAECAEDDPRFAPTDIDDGSFYERSDERYEDDGFVVYDSDEGMQQLPSMRRNKTRRGNQK